MSNSHPGLGLRGRRTELAALDRLLAEARAGQSRVLVLRGEAGVGKTALLDYLQEQASGFRVGEQGDPGRQAPTGGCHCVPTRWGFHAPECGSPIKATTKRDPDAHRC